MTEIIHQHFHYLDTTLQEKGFQLNLPRQDAVTLPQVLNGAWIKGNPQELNKGSPGEKERFTQIINGIS